MEANILFTPLHLFFHNLSYQLLCRLLHVASEPKSYIPFIDLFKIQKTLLLIIMTMLKFRSHNESTHNIYSNTHLCKQLCNLLLHVLLILTVKTYLISDTLRLSLKYYSYGFPSITKTLFQQDILSLNTWALTQSCVLLLNLN